MNRKLMLLHQDLSLRARYASAALIYCLAMLLRLLILPSTAGLPFLTLYPATVATFYFLGTGPGLMVTMLGAVSGYFAFITPQWSFELIDRGYYMVGVYLAGAALSAIVIDQLQRYARNLHQALVRLQDSENCFRSFMNCGHFLSWMKDKDGRYVYLNQRYEQFLELAPENWRGKSDLELFPPSTAEQFRENDHQALQTNQAITVEEDTKTAEGKTQYWLSTRFPYLDSAGTQYVGGIAVDITKRKEAEEQIESLAFYDPLTNLPNRRLLLDRLKHILDTGERSSRIGALLFIDLDNFKALNDTYGHSHGDMLLRQVAHRLQVNVRKGDTLARFGGDEFVILLEDLSQNTIEAATQAESAGEKILRILGAPYLLDGKSYNSTPSIGITLFGDVQETIEGPLKRADLAMYQAKANGRNTQCFFDPQIQAAMTERSQMEEDLRTAIEQRQFVLYYQPQVTGATQIAGAEALVRWQHPQRGLVFPGDFIPLAEDTGLILAIGRWVLEAACAQLALWATIPECAQLTISVNVSSRQFSQTDFVNQVEAAITATGANPQRLKLELTESLLVASVEEVIEKMVALKARGIGFSLDDFGTGYSSLAYLKRLPLDQLKIDQSFVRDIGINANNTAIAKTIIALADSLGLEVIAEGVETEEQRSFLVAHGCETFQGYLFGRPLPIDAFEELGREFQAQLV